MDNNTPQNQTQSSIGELQKALQLSQRESQQQPVTLSKNTSGKNLEGQTPFENKALIESSQSFFNGPGQQNANLKVNIVQNDIKANFAQTEYNGKTYHKKRDSGKSASKPDDLAEIEASARGSQKDPAQLYTDQHMKITSPRVTNIGLDLEEAESPTIIRIKPRVVDSTRFSQLKRDIFGRNAQAGRQAHFNQTPELLGGSYQFESSLRNSTYQDQDRRQAGQFNKFTMPQITSPARQQDALNRQIKNCFRGSKVFHKSSLTKRMTVAHSMNFRQNAHTLQESQESPNGWGVVKHHQLSLAQSPPTPGQDHGDGPVRFRNGLTNSVTGVMQTSMPFKHQKQQKGLGDGEGHIDAHVSSSIIGERQSKGTRASSKAFPDQGQMISDLDLGLSPSGNFQSSIVDSATNEQYFNAQISKKDLVGSISNIRAGHGHSHLSGAQANNGARGSGRNGMNQPNASLQDVSQLAAMGGSHNSILCITNQTHRARNLSNLEAVVKVRNQGEAVEPPGSDSGLKLPQIEAKGITINEDSGAGQVTSPDGSQDTGASHPVLAKAKLGKSKNPDRTGGMLKDQSIQQVHNLKNFGFGVLGQQKTFDGDKQGGSLNKIQEIPYINNTEEASQGSTSLGYAVQETGHTIASSRKYSNQNGQAFTIKKDESILQYPSGTNLAMFNTNDAAMMPRVGGDQLNMKHLSSHMMFGETHFSAIEHNLLTPNAELKVPDPAHVLTHYSARKVFPGGIESYIPRSIKESFETRTNVNDTTRLSSATKTRGEGFGKLQSGISFNAPAKDDSHQISSMDQVLAYNAHLAKQNERNDMNCRIGLKPINQFAEYGFMNAGGKSQKGHRDSTHGRSPSKSVEGTPNLLEHKPLELRSVDSLESDTPREQHRSGSQSPGQRIEQLNRDRHMYLRQLQADDDAEEPAFVRDPAAFAMLSKQVLQPSASFSKAQAQREKAEEFKNIRANQKKKTQKAKEKQDNSKSAINKPAGAQSPQHEHSRTQKQEYYSTMQKTVSPKDMNEKQRAELIGQMVTESESKMQKNQQLSMSKVQQDILAYKKKYIAMQNRGKVQERAGPSQTRKQFLEEARYRIGNNYTKAQVTDSDIQNHLAELNKSRGLLDKKMVLEMLVAKRHDRLIQRLHKFKSREVLEPGPPTYLQSPGLPFAEYDELKIEQDADRLIATHLGIHDSDRKQIIAQIDEIITKKREKYQRELQGREEHDSAGHQEKCAEESAEVLPDKGTSSKGRASPDSPQLLGVPKTAKSPKSTMKSPGKYPRSPHLQVIEENEENQAKGGKTAKVNQMNQSQQNFLKKNLMNKQVQNKLGSSRMSEWNADIQNYTTKTTSFRTKKGSDTKTMISSDQTRNRLNKTQIVKVSAHLNKQTKGEVSIGKSQGGRIVKKEITFEDEDESEEEQILVQDTPQLSSANIDSHGEQRSQNRAQMYTEDTSVSEDQSSSDQSEAPTDSMQLGSQASERATTFAIEVPKESPRTQKRQFSRPGMTDTDRRRSFKKSPSFKLDTHMTADGLDRSPLHYNHRYKLDEINYYIDGFEMNDHIRFMLERKEAKRGLYRLTNKAPVKKANRNYIQLQDMKLEQSIHKLSVEEQERLKEKVKNYKSYNHIVKQFPDLVDDLKEVYKIRDFSDRKVKKALDAAKEAQEDRPRQLYDSKGRSLNTQDKNSLEVDKNRNAQGNIDGILKRPSSMMVQDANAKTPRQGQSVYIQDPDLQWAHLDLLQNAGKQTIQEQFMGILKEIKDRYQLNMRKSKYFKEVEEEKEDDLMAFVSPQVKKMIANGELDAQKKKEVLKQAKLDRDKEVAYQKQLKKEKDMEKKQGQGGMSANDIVNLMNDDQMIKRYTEHLLSILFSHRDPFMTAAYLKWKGKNTKPSFYERMQREIRERQEREAAEKRAEEHEAASANADGQSIGTPKTPKQVAPKPSSTSISGSASKKKKESKRRGSTLPGLAAKRSQSEPSNASSDEVGGVDISDLKKLPNKLDTLAEEYEDEVEIDGEQQ